MRKFFRASLTEEDQEEKERHSVFDGNERWYGAQKYLTFQRLDRYALRLMSKPRNNQQRLRRLKKLQQRFELRRMKLNVQTALEKDLKAVDVLSRSFAEKEHRTRDQTKKKELATDHEKVLQEFLIGVIESHFNRLNMLAKQKRDLFSEGGLNAGSEQGPVLTVVQNADAMLL